MFLYVSEKCIASILRVTELVLADAVVFGCEGIWPITV